MPRGPRGCFARLQERDRRCIAALVGIRALISPSREGGAMMFTVIVVITIVTVGLLFALALADMHAHHD